MKLRATILSIFVALISGSASGQPSDDLLNRLMGYFAVTTFTDAGQNATTCNSVKELCTLGETIDSLDRDLSRTFLFVNKVQILRLNQAGVYDGQKRGSIGPATVVFVTEPVMELNGAVLAFVSASSPSRVAIFSLDKNLKGDLVYDSFTKSTYVAGSTMKERDPIESIAQLTIRPDRKIVVRERSTGAISHRSRVFLVELEGGHAILRLVR